jgi:DNA/RNA-binding domain of Phe-tRNA-synthetase-like protein
MHQKTLFRYHPTISEHFPNLCGGVINAKGMHNPTTPPDLQQEFIKEQRIVIERLGIKPLSEIPSLAAWRSAFRTFGVDPTRYRSAAEALLRRLTKKGDIPSINTLVDIGNLVSIRYALPVAVFDTRNLNGGITVHFAEGTETFHGIGEEEKTHPEPGEVIFSDSAGAVVARRWCWRQSIESTAHFDTHDIIITVEAQHPGANIDIQAALDELVILLRKFTGGNFETNMLS